MECLDGAHGREKGLLENLWFGGQAKMIFEDEDKDLMHVAFAGWKGRAISPDAPYIAVYHRGGRRRGAVTPTYPMRVR